MDRYILEHEGYRATGACPHVDATVHLLTCSDDERLMTSSVGLVRTFQEIASAHARIMLVLEAPSIMSYRTVSFKNVLDTLYKY